MSQPLKTTITHRGQTYVDEPVVVKPKGTPLELAVGALFNSNPQPIVVAHERVRLRWMSGSKGGNR